MNTKIFSLTFRKHYFLYTVLLFLIELGIALFVRDRFIRPYVGDFLVVILIYYFLRAFWDQSPAIVAIVVLIFSFTVEGLQYFQLVDRLGLSDSKLAQIVLGTSFHWLDLVMYALGVLLVYWIDRKS